MTLKILFIALEFAPVQVTGAIRSVKFAKYLPEMGIEPVVVTIDPVDSSKIYGVQINPRLIEDLGYEPPTHFLKDDFPVRSTENRLQKFIRIQLRTDDSFYTRLKRSFHGQLDQIISEHNLSAVYVSLPPFGAGRLALDAVKRTGLPLIVDMRDAWSQWSTSPFPTYAHYRIALRQEAELLSTASAIVTVTEELSHMFQRSHPTVPANRFHVIPNGIDSELPNDLNCTWGDDSDRFKVAYVGRYYYDPVSEADRNKGWYRRRPTRWLNHLPVNQQWIYRTPIYFFKAIQYLRQESPDIASRFEFHQIGDTPQWLTEMAASFELQDQFVSHGVVAREQVAETLAKMDACLVTSIKVPGGDDYCLASKTFDYIQANKLLLSFVARGSQKQFCEAVGGSEIFDPDEISMNAERLRNLLKRTRSSRFETGVLRTYQRRETTTRLACLINNLLKNNA